MINEIVLEQRDFPIEGKLYTVRKLKRKYDIVDKETGIHVNKLFDKNCMKTFVRQYLGLFGIEVGTHDGIKTGRKLKQLMDILKENEFVTYQRNIHKNCCTEIGKHGGRGTNVEYHYFRNLDEAKDYANQCHNDQNLRIDICSRCLGE